MTVEQAERCGELHLAQQELAWIERLIGTGSARDATGQWSASEARRLNRLRHREAISRAHIDLLQGTAS